MTTQRATTTLDAGVVRLENRWVARSWTAFTGVTMELQQFPEDFEWTTRRSGEFSLETNRGIVGPREALDVEWSEEMNPFGAAVVAKRAGEGVEVVLRTFAFHELPCLLRRCTVYNTGSNPLRISRCAPDVLALRADGAWVRTNQLAEERESIQWETGEDRAAVVLPNRGVVLGMASGGVYELFSPEPTLCAVYTRDPVVILPGGHWSAPDVSLAFFDGELDTFMSRTWADIKRNTEQLWEWELKVK